MIFVEFLLHFDRRKSDCFLVTKLAVHLPYKHCQYMWPLDTKLQHDALLLERGLPVHVVLTIVLHKPHRRLSLLHL